MPGPAPKHPSTRSRARDAKRSGGDFRVLSGREGDVPAWPLQPDVSKTALFEVQRDRIANLQVEVEQAEDGRTRGRLQRELNKLELSTATLQLQIEQAIDAEKALWDELWGFPQAQLWEESRSHRAVALFVRMQIRAEQGDMKAATEARQLSDRLGLNDLALLRLRAEVEQVDKVEDEGEKRRAKATPAKSKSRKKPDDPRGFLAAVK